MKFFSFFTSWFRRSDKAPAAVVDSGMPWNKVLATSFADLEDRRRYERCIARGKSPAFCRGLGDPGIGWLDNVTGTEEENICALPPEIWRPKFSAKANAHRRKVQVRYKGRIVTGYLGDTMPAHPKNGAGIDLNPVFLQALGLSAPCKVTVEWRWA